jgi:D-arabinose 1-dehydrogenase-like Zn-dependent alcohol dehydrogenase
LKAAVLPAVDAPFELRDVADPVAQDGNALVRVRAAGINFLDVLIRRGRYPQMPDFPAVLGVELAGELEDGTRAMAILPAGRTPRWQPSREHRWRRCRKRAWSTGRASSRRG